MKKTLTIALLKLLLCTMCITCHAQRASDDAALSEMRIVKNIIQDYSIRYGKSVEKSRDITDNIFVMAKEGKSPSYLEIMKKIAIYNDAEADYSFVNPYHVRTRRLSKEPLTTPKERGAKGVILYSDKFFNAGENRTNPSGYYTVLWDDYSVSKIPYDESVYAVSAGKNPNSILLMLGFKGEAGLLVNALSYQEFWYYENRLFPPTEKQSGIRGEVVKDNGVESLVMLSRQLRYPSDYGIDRSDIWSEFSLDQAEFTLLDVQKGAEALSLQSQVAALSLNDLQRVGTSAIIFLEDDGRMITLVSIDDDKVVVISRGLTQIVDRSVLEKRYSGEALVPTKALTQSAAIVADDAVRELKLPSLDAEVPQQFVLRNTGTTPITLQLEYPLLGVTESKLSRDTIPPGETATLDLKVKWRSILKAPYQNVLVSIQTNDPIVPRLQLAILLTPPQGVGGAVR